MVISDELASYQRRLVLYAICATLAVVLMVAIPLQQATSALTAAAEDRVTDVSDVSANSINVELTSIASLVGTTSARSAFTAPDAHAVTDQDSAIRTELRDLRASNGNIRSAVFISSMGRLQANEPFDKTTVGFDATARDYFIGAMRTPSSAHISEAYVARLPGNPRVIAVSHTVSRPATPTQQAEVIGVLVATVSADAAFQPYVDNLVDHRGMFVSIYDQNAQLVAGPGAQPSQVSITTDRHVVEGNMGRSATVVNGRGDAKAVRSYSPIGSTGWVAVAEASGDGVFGAVHDLQVRVITTAAMLGVLLLIGFISFTRTMRGRTKARTALVRSEARTRSIIETAAQPFIELDEQFRITEFNKEAEKLFGWRREHVIGKHMSVLQPAAVQDSLREGLERFVANVDRPGEALSSETELLRRDVDEPVPVEVTLWLTELDGEQRINCFIQDISERRRLDAARDQILESQRELVEELRKADKAKGDFMSTVSHELRTPLTSIMGYLEMLNEGYGGDLTDRQTSMLDVVTRNSKRLLSLIEDLLTLSRIEAGSFKLMPSPVDVGFLISTVQQSFVPLTRERSIDLTVNVDPDTGSVMADAHQLERVLLNLMSNAVKFTPEGGSVSVTAERRGDSVMIEVADTGIGIAIDEQKRLFNRFFRASSANDNAIQGTGLGLAIVKGIVEGHGGSISIASMLGKGTTVSVVLPTLETSSLNSSAVVDAI